MQQSSLNSQKTSSLSTMSGRNHIMIFILLTVTTWIAHFWYCTSFGFYEDDWGRVPEAMAMTSSELGSFILKSFEPGGSQGRPFHPILIFLFSFIGSKLGGLYIVYWFGYIFLATNAILFYLLLKRVFENYRFALLGSLALCLFPADTTQPFLTHSLGIQPALTMLLTAFHLYISKKENLSYGIIFLSLLCYETGFPVFLTAPLLKQKWDTKSRKELLIHAAVMGVMLISVTIIRSMTGEGRIAKAGLQEILLMIGNPIVGPITSMAMFVYRPLTTLLTLNRELLVILALCFAIIAWVLSQLKLEQSSYVSALLPEVESKVVHLLKIPKALHNLAKPILLGLTMLILAYPFTIAMLGFSISGRGTRVHTFAAIGGSILFACISSAILNVATTRGWKRLAVLGLTGYFTLLLGFGLIVQQDYKMSWSYQRAFWTDVINLVPDLADGTAIFVEPTGLTDTRQLLFLKKEQTGKPDPRQIKSLDSLYQVLPQLYKFPDSWKIPPRVYRLPMDWQEKLLSDGDLFQRISVEEGWTRIIEGKTLDTVPSSNAILLETKNGRLTRRTDPLILNGKAFLLKKNNSSDLPQLEKRFAYSYLIRKSDEPPVNYLVSK